MGYLRCHDDGPNVLLGRFVQSTLGDWRIDSVTSIAAIFHSALAFNQDLGWCLDYDVDLSADYVGGAFEKTQCASTSCGVLQGDACAPTARPTPNLTPGPTTAALTGAQVVVEIKAAVVLTGIVADDFNSEPEAQQAFSQSILAHLPRGLIDDGTEITDVVAVSIPGECDEAPTYCSNEYTGCWICMPTCSGYWSDCNAYCGSYAHCAWRRRRLQTGVEDVWSRVEVSFTIFVRQDETTATDGGASILAAVTSSLSSAVSSGAFLDTLIREAHAAGASDWLIYHIDVAVVESIISLDKATVTVVNSGSCEVCTDSIYDFVYVSCGVFELKAAKRWGDWDPHESGTDCLSNVCCARHEEDCCEANVGAITGLAVAIFVVLTMCCYVCAGCPGYPCCPDEHFCFSATRFVNNQAVHSKSVWRRCSPPNKDSILNVWRRCCPQHKGTHRNAAAPAPPGVSDAPPADDSTVVAHLQLVTGASAEAARAALAAHGNDVDAAAVALLAAVPSLPPAAKAATQNSRDAPPPYWNAIRDRNKARRFVVDPISDSEEYKRVEISFMLTLDRARFTIQSVERIQNMDLEFVCRQAEIDLRAQDPERLAKPGAKLALPRMFRRRHRQDRPRRFQPLVRRQECDNVRQGRLFCAGR